MHSAISAPTFLGRTLHSGQAPCAANARGLLVWDQARVATAFAFCSNLERVRPPCRTQPPIVAAFEGPAGSSAMPRMGPLGGQMMDPMMRPSVVRSCGAELCAESEACNVQRREVAPSQELENAWREAGPGMRGNCRHDFGIQTPAIGVWASQREKMPGREWG